jgi:hypothetical protein
MLSAVVDQDLPHLVSGKSKEVLTRQRFRGAVTA